MADLSKATDRKIAKFGAMPNRLSTLKDPAMQKEYPEFSAVLENLKYANPDWRPLIPEWPEISMSHVGIALHEAITGKKTPEQAMTDAGRAGEEDHGEGRVLQLEEMRRAFSNQPSALSRTRAWARMLRGVGARIPRSFLRP